MTRIKEKKSNQDELKSKHLLLHSKQINDNEYYSANYHKSQTLKSNITSLLHSKVFHLIIVLMSALDGLLVICMLLLEIEALKLKTGIIRSRLILTSFIFECTSFAIVSLFLIEIPIKLWGFGCGFYRKQWVEILDAIVCVVSFAVDAYNIYRHIEHSKHSITDNHETVTMTTNSEEQFQQSVKGTIADAAGLLVLFRLWRVIRIVNAILVSVTSTHEGTIKKLKESQITSQKRIEQLERTLHQHGIPIPPISLSEYEDENDKIDKW